MFGALLLLRSGRLPHSLMQSIPPGTQETNPIRQVPRAAVAGGLRLDSAALGCPRRRRDGARAGWFRRSFADSVPSADREAASRQPGTAREGGGLRVLSASRPRPDDFSRSGCPVEVFHHEGSLDDGRREPPRILDRTCKNPAASPLFWIGRAHCPGRGSIPVGGAAPRRP